MEIKNSIGLFILNGEAPGIQLLGVASKDIENDELPLFDLDITVEDLISIVYKLTDKLGIATITNEIALTHVVEKNIDDNHHEYQYWFTVVSDKEELDECELYDVRTIWIEDFSEWSQTANISEKLKNNIENRIANGWRAAPIDYINDSEEGEK